MTAEEWGVLYIYNIYTYIYIIYLYIYYQTVKPNDGVTFQCILTE